MIHPRHLLTAGLLLVLASCGRDAAEREYFAALRGEEEGMTREAQIAHLSSAIAIAPRRSWYWETRGTYRTDLRDFAGAIADLDRAIELHDRPYLQFQRGLVECQSGRPATALPYFDRAIEGQPENTQFYRGRSLARTATGDPEGGLADAEVLVARAPQQAESHHALGVALAALGRDSAAVAAFDEAIRRRPELVYPLAARAEAYERLGDRRSALADRAVMARLAEEQAGCAPCLDPYRY